jgi:hypothetical protein
VPDCRKRSRSSSNGSSSNNEGSSRGRASQRQKRHKNTTAGQKKKAAARLPAALAGVNAANPKAVKKKPIQTPTRRTACAALAGQLGRKGKKKTASTHLEAP